MQLLDGAYNNLHDRHLWSFYSQHDRQARLVKTVERVHAWKRYGDIARGIFIIRGDNLSSCGRFLQQVCIEDILEEQRLQQQTRQKGEKTKHLALKEKGHAPTRHHGRIL
ncbi:unnamed protein product, partial [Coregonus sp. 'balchen']